MGSSRNQVYGLEPGKKKELLKKLQKWVKDYGDEIKKHIAKPGNLQYFINLNTNN